MITLSISLILAIISFYVWKVCSYETKTKFKLINLVYMFVGASLMWSIDAFFEISELGFVDCFTNNTPSELMDDFLLGLTVTGFALMAWTLSLCFRTKKVAF